MYSCNSPEVLYYYLNWFPRATITKDHKPGGLKTPEVYPLTVPEANSLKLRRQQHHVPSESSREESFLLVASDNPWPVVTSLLCFRLHTAFYFVCLCVSHLRGNLESVSNFPSPFSYKDISHWF